MKQFKESFLLERCSQELTISEAVYSIGYLDVVDFLISEMIGFMKEENRFFGIVKSYANTISDTYSVIHEEMTEDDIEVYGRILFLFKPSIKREYRWLISNRRLSKADAVIVLIHKMLEVVNDTQDFKFRAELKTLQKIFNGLFGNIRNKGKEAQLYDFTNSLRTFRNSGLVGKYPLDRFSFNEEYEKKPVSGSNLRVKEESDDKIFEVSLE